MSNHEIFFYQRFRRNCSNMDEDPRVEKKNLHLIWFYSLYNFYLNHSNERGKGGLRTKGLSWTVYHETCNNWPLVIWYSCFEDKQQKLYWFPSKIEKLKLWILAIENILNLSIDCDMQLRFCGLSPNCT